MSAFLDPLRLDAVEGGWRYVEPFRYRSSWLKQIVTAAAGDFTDLASIPKFIPRWIFDVANGPTRLPAAIHDPLCKKEYKILYNISQLDADIVLLEACAVNGVPKWKIVLVGLGVIPYQLFKHRSNYWKRL